MGDWLRGLEIHKPSSVESPEKPVRHLDAATVPSTRPLSDIRELTEPSLIDILARKPNAQMRYQPSLPNFASAKHASPLRRTSSNKVKENLAPSRQLVYARLPEPGLPSSSSYSTTPEQSSIYNIPHSAIPQRSSSQIHSRNPSLNRTRNPSICVIPPPTFLPADRHTNENLGRGRSPVKAIQVRLDPVTADSQRRVPSKTRIRDPPPIDILEYPAFLHHRVEVELQVSASVFVGGGTIEGSVKIIVDGNKNIRHRELLRICSISVDLLGYEEVGSRRAPFLALGTELIDAKHPPPTNMVDASNLPLPGDKSWRLVSSTSTLPFILTLPLDTGSPPFQCVKASITFLLSATAFVRLDGRPYRPVRSSQELQILPTYDPEKALTCLQNPLTVFEEYYPPKSDGRENVKLTAGLHRQVWLSGSSIFVDVHICNRTRKAIRRLDLELERNILIYKHAPTTSRARTANHIRIFEDNQRSIVATHSFRSGSNKWSGVAAYNSETRTYDLELPRGHATIQCGRYFEVCFFLNIIASVSTTKLVSVQLPIILIHINSLDIVPNSVAQVAAAIVEKRNGAQRQKSRHNAAPRHHATGQRSTSSPGRASGLRHRPPFTQGRAFVAPREQSLDLERGERAVLQDLTYALDASPRKHAARLHGLVIKATEHPPVLPVSHRPPEDRIRTPHKTRPPLAGLTYNSPTPPSTASTSQSAHASSRSSARRRRRHCDLPSRPSPPSPAPSSNLASHSLGLASATNRLSHGTAVAQPHLRPATATAPDIHPRAATAGGFRDKLDRSRFEFKAVRRKASGGLVERGLEWWEGWRGKAEGKSRFQDIEREVDWPSYEEKSEWRRQEQKEMDRAGWI
nr:uncharacterized protein CFP56_11369 [Quercus suber]